MNCLYIFIGGGIPSVLQTALLERFLFIVYLYSKNK